MRPCTTIAAALLALILTGCASVSRLGDAFANRVSCTADGSQALISSMYGPIGIASVVAPADAAALCRRPAQ